ncbi:MAG TPA: SAM-dependent chlorinase/fluorinase [Acidimicrobiales bacterium]|nr:SAM-dependent chlorinase/fluorinase [Acidimicrobiales bacterium]
MTVSHYSTISFLSDYGHEDEFVGVVKSVIRSINESVEIFDITHGIKPHDVRAGGLALARASQYILPGIVVAIVDPGVGTERRAIAIEINHGETIFIGPDNGLLAPAIAMVGEPTRAVELNNPKFHLPSLSSTFAGRDIFAPVAAHLCNGAELSDFGTAISLPSLHPGLMPVSSREGDLVLAEILWKDHFGNLQLNISEDDISDFGEHMLMHVGEQVRGIRRTKTFEGVSESEIGLIVDSTGLLALTMFGRSTAEELRLDEGQQVKIENGGIKESTSTIITLKKKS